MSENSLAGDVVVPEVCTLPTVEQPVRLAEIDELLSTRVRRVDRLDSVRLRLELEPDAAVAAQTADLVMRESACCSFFTFTLTATGGTLTLDVTVPSAYVDVLDAMAARS